jgi:adenylate cyclase
MKKLFGLVFLILFILPAPASARDEIQSADSLIRLLQINPEDTTLLKELCSTALNISDINQDSAYFYASELYRLSDQVNYRFGLAEALNLQGRLLEQQDFKRSIEKYEQSLSISKNEGYRKLQSITLNNLSIVYSYMGEYNKSIENLLQLLQLAEAMGDDMRKAVALNNIGLRYHDMGNPELALSYYNRAMQINLNNGNMDRYATNLSNIGNAYQVLWLNNPGIEGYYDSALMYQNNAIRLHRRQGAIYKLQYAFQSLIHLYYNKDQINKAWMSLDSAMYYANLSGDSYGIINLMSAKADLLNNEKRFEESAILLEEAIEMALKLNFRSLLIDLYEEVSESYHGQKNYPKAYEYNQKFKKLEDSIQNKEKSKAFAKISRYEKEKERQQRELQEQKIENQRLVRNSIIIVGALILLMLIGLWQRYRFIRRTKVELENKNQIIEIEKGKSDNLLMNILPEKTANELKAFGKSEAQMFEMVTVMFADFKGFTMMAEKMTPQELVDEIDFYYKQFDEIIFANKIEKIKTIGDSYMCAGGLPVANTTNPQDVVTAACMIRDFMETHKKEKAAEGKPFFEARIGIHTGPVVAGIVGTRKFAYDIWGDTVNIASRMESSGEVSKINISQFTWEYVKDKFITIPRGKIQTKNKGLMDMYFVECINPAQSSKTHQS